MIGCSLSFTKKRFVVYTGLKTHRRPLGSVIGPIHTNSLSKRFTAPLKMRCGLFGDYVFQLDHDLPVSTWLGVESLAEEGFLIEVDAVAVAQE